MDDLDFVSYCCGRLTPIELRLFIVLRAFGPCHGLTPAELNEAVGNPSSVVKYPKVMKAHIRTLKQKGFVACSFTHKEGLDLQWVRSKIEERAPKSRDSGSFSLKSPEGRVHRFRRGQIKATCKELGLTHSRVCDLVAGRISEYRGWTVYS